MRANTNTHREPTPTHRRQRSFAFLRCALSAYTHSPRMGKVALLTIVAAPVRFPRAAADGYGYALGISLRQRPQRRDIPTATRCPPAYPYGVRRARGPTCRPIVRATVAHWACRHDEATPAPPHLCQAARAVQPRRSRCWSSGTARLAPATCGTPFATSATWRQLCAPGWSFHGRASCYRPITMRAFA